MNSLPFAYPKPNSYINEKVNFVKPFKYVGIDFTGNFPVKLGEKRVKMYILIFSCLNTRAVHLELLPSMDCKGFLLSFIRFTNAHSIPSSVYSDNASTFLQGLGIIKNSVANDEFSQYLDKNSINHYKIPLYSAWIGSFWERMIKTMKSCLYKVIGRKVMDYFSFITLLSDVQNSLNSRPLTYKDNDVNFEPITPNHFIKLDIGKEILFENLVGTEIELPIRKKLVDCLETREQMFENFKDVWFDEYLLSLRESSREVYQDGWYNRIAVGDVVLVSSPNKPRPFWGMGRVTEILPGQDGAVRCVRILRADKSEGIHSTKLLYPLELAVTPSFLKSPAPEEPRSDDNISKTPRRAAARRCLDALRNSN